MKKMDKNATDQIGYYFRKEKWLLLTVTITGILYNVGMVAGPWFEGQMVQYLCDIIGGQKRPSAMVRLAGCYVLTIFFVQFMRYLKRLYVRKFANNISKNMKMTLYRNLLYQKKEEHEDAGTMMTKIIADADACVEGMRKFTTEIFDTGIVMIAYLVMLLSYDWRLTILSMLFPPIAYILAERLKIIVTRNVALSRESSGRLNASTLERITNALTYRIYGQEKNRNAEYELYLADYEKKAIRANLWENVMQPVYQVISMIGTVMIIWFGERNVLGTGWSVWNIAAFSTFFACYRKLAVKSSKAAKLFNAVQKAEVSWKRIKPYLKEIQEEKRVEHTQAATLEVSGLTFAWPGQNPLFANVTFKGNPGQILGITGEVACGKSTFGRIFTGELLYDGKITMGNVSFDGKGEYINEVGYLGHQPELFDGTIEDNICMGKPGDVEEVLRAVCMDQEVELLPEKIYTRIGSGGVRLSGGQQARIALARTLYHKKPLMILDDPFSAVDMETEKQIYENLRLWGKDSVILLISHRLGLFPKFDQVLWLENGKVCVASHDKLIQEEEHYRLLYEEQRRGGKVYAE
ncbi:ABC transporter ATP-binding protein [Fusicatenibacter saccharivorans]|uniref:ABC transporter ATP-binding protein n=2 Tax=Lachnospirales TaxID=3085636 RepID=UPI003CFF399D